jgi:parallel beta-helix repeat protein
VFVSPSGDDGAAGGPKAPLATLRAAISRARDGATIVLRAGTYHDSVTVPSGKRLTLQAHPGEVVWLDGSVAVQGWRPEPGGVWRHDGWTARFDSSPTYTAGARPSDDADFQFVDKAFPMAAHPDQVWVGGVALRQVGSRAKVRPGTFFVDYTTGGLYIGADPATGQVRASDLAEALTVQSAGSVVRGIGVRRYATPLPRIAAVKAQARGVSFENVVVTDSATTGLSAMAQAVTFRHVTIKRSGMLGIHATYADRLRLDAVRLEHNNLERFKTAPVAGGFKVTRSRDVTVTGSAARYNHGKGLWLDESVHGITLVGNDIVGNTSHAISLELSAEAVVADNLISDNAGDGIRVNNTARVRIWNNTVLRNGRGLHLVQDPRKASDLSVPGHDPRQKLPDPTVTWMLGDISIGNNAIAQPRREANCVLCVEDHTHERSAAAMRITADGDVYTRVSPRSPSWLVVWSRGKGDPATFGSLDAFRSASGQEAHGLSYDSVTAAGARRAEMSAAARPLPAEVARAIGRPAGTRRVGAWRP